jgi:serine/threonine protein kinase
MSAHAGDERLGPYRLREQLGEGGMGVVYLASDPGDQLVAIKVLRQGVAAEPTARRRLEHEVATMRRVASPYVAEIIDADVSGNPPYIVTRYVPGKTLEDVVAASGPITGSALAGLAAGLASALAAVHCAGIVHRDLKPGNVMLLDGKPVVIDFGIALTADSTRLTMTGMFMGTPGYLAPEVIEGRPSGPAADIHSWGATMAYAATGRPPFGTGTFEAIFYRIVHGQPDLTAMPASLVPLVLSALARDPARRPSATDLAEHVACLDPALLVPGSAAAMPLGAAMPFTSTSPDLARPLAAAIPAAQAGAVAWPGTMPLKVAGRDDYADLLPPVRYAQMADPPSADQRQNGPPSGLPLAGPFAISPVQPPGTLSPQAPAAGTSGSLAGGQNPPLAGPAPARRPLVLATVVAFVAAAVALPVGGAAAVLLLLIVLRSVDLTASRLARRKTTSGRVGAGAMAAFFPWAACRSVLRFVLLAPMALLCAAAAAAIAVLAAGPSQLPRVGGWAAGALVACYCLGPGSVACRRPISKFYGRVTRSGIGATAGFICLAVLAVLAVSAAASLAPGYWPATHLGHQLQNATLNHPLLNNLPGNLGQVSKRLISWVGHRL